MTRGKPKIVTFFGAPHTILSSVAAVARKISRHQRASSAIRRGRATGVLAVAILPVILASVIRYWTLNVQRPVFVEEGWLSPV